MRLLFRHIKNSVLRAPYQTIVLLLTIFFSAMIFASVSEVRFAISEEKRLAAALGNGRAQIALQADENSASRYLTQADVCEEEEFSVSGYFVLPLAANERTVAGAATDFNTVGNVFDFSFVEYQPFSPSEKSSVLFITEEYAKKHGLEIGDNVEVKLLGKPKDYVVRGIQRYPFFGRYDLLMDSEGALGVLSAVSPVFAVFDGEAPPCSNLFVCLRGGQVLNESIETLNARLSAFGWRALEVTDGTEEYNWKLLNVLMALILLLSMVVAWSLVGFSLRILGEKRQEEMQAFLLAGMSQRKIFFALACEIFLYLTLATAAGILCTWGFLRSVGNAGMYYATLRLTKGGVWTAIVAEFVVGAVSLCTYRFSAKSGKKGGRYALKWLIAMLSLLFVCLIFGALFPVKWRVYVAAGILAFALLAILFSATPYCRGLSNFFTARIGKGKTSPHLVLATKNCANVKELHNVYRLVNIILSLFVVLTVSFNFCNREFTLATNYFKCDYMVANAGAPLYEAAMRTEGVESASIAYTSKAEFFDGRSLPLIDGDISYIAGEGEMPVGDGICLPQAVANTYGYKLGDEVTVKISSTEYTFTLAGYSGKNSFFGYVDAESNGFRQNTILIRVEEGADKEEVLSKLTEELSVYGAIIGKPTDLLYYIIRIVNSFNDLMGLYLGFLFVLGGIGCINLVWVSYARRRKDFSDLVMVGMTKGEVGKMIAIEGGIMLLSVALVSAITSGILCFALDCGLSSFGYRLFV